MPTAAASTTNLNGGILQLITGSATAVAFGSATNSTFNYQGGGHILLSAYAGGQSTLNALRFNRMASMNGTLVLDVASGFTLGLNAGNGVRVVSTNIAVGGVDTAIASANTNGILIPTIIGNSASNIPFFVTGDATNGIIPYAGTLNTGISTATPITINDFTSGQALTSGVTTYAIRTNSNLSTANGSALRITSNGTLSATGGMGGLLTYGTPTISAPVIFDPSGSFTLTALSTTVGSTTVNVTSTAGLLAGMTLIGGPGLPAGATVAAITNSTSFTISSAALQTRSGETATAANLSATTTVDSSEGIIYTGGTTTLSGGLYALNLTKFGAGTLLLQGNVEVFGNTPLKGINVQEGTLQVDTSTRLVNLITSINLGGSSTLDLNGSTLTVGSFNGAKNVTSGVIGNSSTSAPAELLVKGIASSYFSGRIVDTLGAGTSTTAITKMGVGTLTLSAPLAEATDASTNTYTGGTNLWQGTIIAQTPFALGGFGSAAQPTVSLYGGQLNFQADGGLMGSTIIFGNQSGTGLTMNVRGPATVNVDRLGNPFLLTSGNMIQVGNLNLSNQTLTVTGVGAPVPFAPVALGAYSVNGTNVVTLTSTMTTANVFVGMQVFGNSASFPAGAYVTSILSPTTFTISATAASGTGNLQPTFTFNQNSNSITAVNTSTAGMYVGMQISGGSVPAGSFITGITSLSSFTWNGTSGSGGATGQTFTFSADTNNILKYGLKVGGTTAILGSYAAINTSGVTGPQGRVELAGAITGSGNLIKLGAGTLDTWRNLIISGTANSGFTGGIDVQQGLLQVTATSGTPLGSAQVRVFPGAGIRLADNGSLNSTASLVTLSKYNSLSTVVLDGDFTPTVLTSANPSSANLGSAYGFALAIARPYFSSPLDLGAIGDGNAVLQGLLNTDVNYIAPTLGVGAGNTYRLAGGPASTLIFSGSDNVLTGTAKVSIGLERNNWLGGSQTGAQNSVVFRNSNNYSGGTSIYKGMTITLDVGAAPGGSTPLGTGTVEVFGTLQLGTDPWGYNGTTSYFNNATGANANSYILRPGGNIIINEVWGQVAGGQGRWADATGIDLNGGTFRYNGAQSMLSAETIGDLTVSKGGRITVTHANAGSGTLNVGSLTRNSNGSLILNSSAAGSWGVPTGGQPTAYDRLTTTSTIALGGTTLNGTGVINTGIAPVWIVDATTTSYVTYNPTGLGVGNFYNVGFQALSSAGGTIGVGQVEYGVRMTAGGAWSTGTTISTSVVDMTAAYSITAGYNPSVYALRTNNNITSDVAGNDITVASGGMIVNGNITINPVLAVNATFTSLTGSPGMRMYFGASGSSQAVIYTSGITGILNARVYALGLLKFGDGTLTLQGSNTITGPIVVNNGTLRLINPLSSTGTAINSVSNGQDIYMQGATLTAGSYVSAPTGFDAIQVSGVQVTSVIAGNIYLTGDSGIYARDSGGGATNQSSIFGGVNFSNLGAGTALTLTTGGNLYFTGATSFGASNNVINAGFDNSGRTIFTGAVTGGKFTKLGNGSVEFSNPNNSFGTAGQVGIDVYASDINTATSVVQSLARTGTPFGVGDIVLNPGTALSILSASNIANQKVTAKTDGFGLSGLLLSYSVTQAELAGLIATTPTVGKINFATTGRYLGGIGLGAGFQYTALDIGALETAAGGGKLWLGAGGGSGSSSLNPSGVYFAPTLGSSTDGVYRIGFGGNQNSLYLGGNAFENVLTGNKSVVYGANVAEDGTSTVMMVNGNMSAGNWNNGVVLNLRNDYTGGTMINPGTNIRVANNLAFGTGKISINQVAGATVYGAFRIDGTFNQVVLKNEIDLIGDLAMRGDANNRDLLFLGNVNLSPGGVSATHNIYVDTDNNGWSIVGFLGGVSGELGSNLNKTGGRALLLRGNNTYQGTTTVTTGWLVLGSSALPNVPGSLGNSATPLVLADGNNAILQLGDIMTLGRDIQLNATGTNNNYIVSASLYRATISGTIQTSSTATAWAHLRTINRTSVGTLDVTGNIIGASNLRIGDTTNNGNTDAGVVRLLNNVNGYSTNTFTGGVNLQNARLVLGADTLWSGTLAAPFIISGPLGTGTLMFDAGATDTGTDRVGSIGSNGLNLTIPNQLNFTMSAGLGAGEAIKFEGRGSINFIRTGAITLADGDANNGQRARFMRVNTELGVISLGGDLTLATTANGSVPTKDGFGILFYNGNNMAGAYTSATAALVGTSWQVSAGTLVVNRDTSLGMTYTGSGGFLRSASAPANWTLGRSTLVNLNGGTLAINGTFQSDHEFVLAANSILNVVQGNTFTLRGQDQATEGAGGATAGYAALSGLFTLTKSGLGAMVMNPVSATSTWAAPVYTGVNTNTGLAIGGYNPWVSASATVDNRLNSVTSTNLSGNPFVAVNGTIIINGGLLGLTNTTGASQTMALGATSTVNYGGGGYLSIAAPTGAFVNSLSTNTFAQSANTKGTLTIMGADLTNFGQGNITQKFTSTTGAGIATTGTRGILDTASVVMRNAAANSDATFANYSATNGFLPAALTTLPLPLPLTGLSTNGVDNTITVASTTGLVIGMSVVGPNIPSGATVASITDATHFVTSGAIPVAGSAGAGSAYTPQVSLAAIATTLGGNTVTVTSTSGLLAGMVVSGPNIPAGSTVVSVTNGTTFVINSAATALGSAGTGFGFAMPVALNGLATTNANGSITVLSTVGLSVGMLVSGPGIPSGSTVGAITDATHFTLGASALASATTTGGTGVAGESYFSKITTATAISGLIEQYAVQLGANLTLTNSTDMLRITGGGLIMNGSLTTGPTISGAGTLSFGTLAGPGDAYVYVREGQTGTTSTISANFRAADFIKAGAGTLILSGTANVMPVPNLVTTSVRTLFVQEGILRFSSSASVPTGGAGTSASVNLQVNDTGTLDLNGLVLTFGSLAGTGFVTNASATPATLTIATGYNQLTQIFTGVIRDGAGVVSLAKSGYGTATISTPISIGSDIGNNAFSGGTTVNAGFVFSANIGALVPQSQTAGATTGALGKLIINNPLALGSGGITLAGGILSFGNTVNVETVASQPAQQFGAGAGYNVTIAALNNFGSPNITSNLDGPTGTAAAVINNLTVNSAGFIFTGGVSAQLSYGMLVAGTATFTQANTTISTGYQLGGTTVGSATFAGPIIAQGGAGTITKTGPGNLYLYPWNQTADNQVAAWNVAGGIFEVRGATGMFNLLGANATVTLNDTTLNTRYDGDGTEAFELITTNATNNIVVGSLASTNSASFIGSRNPVIDHRPLNSGTNGFNQGVSYKTVVFQDIAFGGALGAPYLSVNGGGAPGNSADSMRAEFRNVSMIHDAYLSLGIVTTLTGAISGAGTLAKTGSDLWLSGDSSAFPGGYTQFGGTTFFGTREGNLMTLSNTAKLTSGNILIQAGTAIQFNSANNVVAGWTGELDMRSRLYYYPILRVAGDFPLTAINLRVGGMGAPQDYNTVQYSTLASTAGFGRNSASIVLAIDAVYTQNLDLGKIGDGTSWLGSTSNALGAMGVYNGSSLGVGAGNIYRLGSGGSQLYFGSNGNANILTDLNLRNIANVQVGMIYSGVQVDNVSAGYGRGTATLLQNQNYTGYTLINLNANYDVRGTLATTSVENYGTLTLGGLGGTFVKADNSGNIVTDANFKMRPASTLRFDYGTGILPAGQTEGTGGQGRWADATPIRLDSSTLSIYGNHAFDVTETVGAVTGIGGNSLEVRRDSSGHFTMLQLSSLIQATDVSGIAGNNATFRIFNTNNPGGIFGSDERIKVAGGMANISSLSFAGVSTPAVITNGMVPPWMFNTPELQFMTHTDFGFVNAGFDRTWGATTITANSGLATDRTYTSGATTVNDTFTLTAYALRLDGNLTTSNVATGTATLKLISGGLAVNGGQTININKIVIGDGVTPADFYVWNNSGNSMVFGDLNNRATTAQWSANTRALIWAGTANLELYADQQTFVGNVIVNSGNIVLRNNATTPATYKPIGGGGNVVMNSPNGIYYIRTAAAVTFTGGLIVGQNNTRIRIDNDRDSNNFNTAIVTLSGGLTFLGAPGEQGQTVQYQNANAIRTQFNGPLNLGPDGNYAHLSIVNNNSNIAYFVGKVTGDGLKSAILIKEQDGTLEIANIAAGLNDWTGGLIVAGGGNTNIRGNTLATGAGPNALNPLANGGLGTGALTLARDATTILYFDGVGTTYERLSLGNTANSVSLIVNSSSTLQYNNNGATSSNKLVSFKDMTIGNAILTTQNLANNYALDIFGTTYLRGNATISNYNDVVLHGNIDDNGSGITLFKNWNGNLWITATNTSFTGGIILNSYQTQQGALRFGDFVGGGANQGSATATIGSGQIRINPNAQIHLEDVTNIAGGNRQLMMVSAASHYSLVALRDSTKVNNFTQAYLNTLFTTDSVGILALESNETYTGSLDMSTIGSGRMYLGAGNVGGVTNNGNFTGATMTAGAGSLYRLGGGTLDVNGALNIDSTSALGALSGANSVIIGAQAQYGVGRVRFRDLNTYTGGTVINRGSVLEANQTSSVSAGPLGVGGNVDIFGELALNLSTTEGTVLAYGSTINNAYTVNIHPGSRLSLDSNGSAGMINRWGDAAPMFLNSAILWVRAPNSGTANNGVPEAIGALTIAGGVTIDLQKQNNFGVYVTATTFTRQGDATILFNTQAGGMLGLAQASNNSSRLVIGTPGTPGTGAPVNSNGMMPGWAVSAQDYNYVKYDATSGFQQVGYDSNITNGIVTPGQNTGTTKVLINTTAAYLQDDPVFYALRADSTIYSGTGQFNTITLKEATTGNPGDMGGLMLTSNMSLWANLKFGSTGTGDAYIYTQQNQTSNLYGDISAGKVIKFGIGALSIYKDQTDAARGPGAGLTANWSLNQGNLNLYQFGAAGTGSITVWGGPGYSNTWSQVTRMDGGTQTAAELRLYAYPSSMLAAKYSFGTLFVKDSVRLYVDPGADDRTIVISDLSLDSSDATGLVPGHFRYETNRVRQMVIAGTTYLTGAGSMIIDTFQTGGGWAVEGFNKGTGLGEGLSIASLDNGGSGTRGLLKWGNAELFIRGASANFAGPVTIDQGAIQVNDNASLGTGAITVNRYGVLEINKAGWAPTNSSLTYNLESAERWSVDGARNGLTVNLGAGSLMIAADQFTATGVVVQMNGGGIEGWMRGTDLLDNTLGTIYRTIGSGVSFQLLGNSFVGQNITASNGGIDTGRFPNPNGQLTGASGARGVILEILGGFSGAGKLTKQGFDTVIISGASSHAGGTSVTQGTLRIGAADVLPTTGTLSTSITGVFDLNGFAQTVGTLTSNNANTPGATSGFIINSATNTVTLTVGNGSTANMVYNGQIQDNLALVKMGTGVLTLTNANTYIGGTTVNEGVLDVSNTLAGGSATGIAPVTIAGGTLAGAGAISSQVVLNSGNIKTGSYVAGVNQPGILSVGGLTINGGALSFKLDAPTSLTDDMIRITAKDLSASVKSLQLNAALTSINITALAGFKVGTYTLIDYSAAGATLGGSFDTTFTGLGVLYPTAPSAKYFLTVQNNTVGNSIDLLVQANTSAVWSGLGDGKWNTATGAIPANWANLAGSPTDYTDGFDTVFNDTATNTAVSLSGIVKPLSMTFSGTKNFTLGVDAPAAGYRITDNTTAAYTGTTTSGSKVLTLTIGTTAGLTPGMALTGAGLGPNTIIDSVDSDTQVTLTVNAIANGTANNLVGTTKPTLTKLGTGTLTINTYENDFTGGTYLTAGTLVLGTSALSKATGPLGGGTVYLNGGTIKDNGALYVTIYNDIVIGGNVGFGTTGAYDPATAPASGLIFSDLGFSAITLSAANAVLTVNNRTEFYAPIGGAGKGLTKAGNGELVLSASANTYTGLTTVNAGKLTVISSLFAGNSLTVGPSGRADFSNASNGQALGAVINNGQLNFTAPGVSTIASLSGASTGVLTMSAAGITVNSGNYQGTVMGNFKLTKSGTGSDNLVLTNGSSNFGGGVDLLAGTLSISTSTVLASQSIANGPLGSGALSVANLGGNLSTSSGVQTLHNSLILAADLAISGSGAVFTDAGLSASSTTQFAAATAVTLNVSSILTIDQAISGSANLIKSGSGELILKKAQNTFTGTVTVNAGTLSLTSMGNGYSNDSLGSSSSFATNLVINNNSTLRYIGSANSSSDRLFTVGTGGMTLENSGSGALALTNTGLMQMAGTVAVRTLTLTGSNAGANSLAANIPDYSSVLVSLTKSGSGTWALTNSASTFSGNISVNAGVLKASTLTTGGNASSIGKSAALATSITLAGGGILEWIGATDQMTDRLFQISSASTGGLSASGTSGAVLNVAATGAIKSTSTGVATLLLGGSGGTLTKPNLFAPALTDNGAGLMSLTKTDNGVWQIVNAANPMTGVVTLAGGKLLVNTLASGGFASNIGAGTTAAGNIVFGGGTLTYTGAALDWNRLFSLSQGNSGIESSGTGAFNFITPGAILNAGLATSPRVLTLGGTYVGGANTMAGIFSDMGTGLTSLVKAGPGTWILSGASTFTGGVTVENGTLVVTNGNSTSGSLGNGSVATNILRLGTANTTGNILVDFGSTPGLSIANPIVVSNLIPGTATLVVGNASGSDSLTGDVTLGATTNLGKSLTYNLVDGGSLYVAGRILANGTDTTAGVSFINTSGTGNATVTLSGTNTQAGGTTVGAKTTLVISNINALGANVSTNTVNLQGGTIKFNTRFVAGLKESYTRSAMDTTTPFASLTPFAITNSPKMGYTTGSNTAVRSTLTDTTWGSNETWAYSGQVYIAPGTPSVSFAKSIDDAVYVVLDGTVVLNDGTWNNIMGTGAKTVGAGIGGGWHTFEVRFGNGAGGAGAQANAFGWTTSYGFGVSGILGKALDTTTVNANGNNYAAMVDSGMSLFRVDNGVTSGLVLNQGLNVSGSSTFDMGDSLGSVTFGSLTINASTLTMTATGATAASLSFVTTNLNGNATFLTDNTSTLNLGALNDAGTARTLTFMGAGTLVMNTPSTSLVAGSVVSVIAGKIISSDATALTNATVNVGGVGLFQVAGSQTIAGLTGNGSLTLNGNTLTVGAADNLSTTFTGVISDGTTTGGLTKTGNGTLTLSGNNTFTGALTVNAGTLKFGSLTAAGTTAAGTTVGAAGTIDLNGLAIGNEAVTLAGTIANSAASAASLAAGVTLNGAATVSAAAAGPIALNGVVTGTGSLTKTGNGVLTLNGANDYTGGTTVSTGTVKLGHATALGGNAVGTTVAANGTLDVNGFSVANQPLALSGTFTNTSATAATYSGAITGGMSPNLGGNVGAFTLTGGIDLATNSSILNFIGTADITLSGSSGLVTGASSGLAKMNGTGTLTLNAASANALFLEVNSGTVIMNSAIEVMGFNGGHINVGANALTVDDAPTIASDIASLTFTGGSLIYTGSNPFDRSFTVGDGGATFNASGSGQITIGSGSKIDFVNATGTGRVLGLTGDSAAANSFAGTLSDNSENADRVFSSMVKDGVSNWVLNGTKRLFVQSATFDINGGTLGFNADALGDVNYTGDVTMRGTSALRWEAGNSNDLSARLKFADGAHATINITGGSTTFDTGLRFGVAKTADLTKAGAGELVLTKANDFSGGMTVNAGTLTVNHASALGSGLATVNTATLNLGAAVANDVTVNNGGTIKGSGSTTGTITLNDGGKLTTGTAVRNYTATNVVMGSGAVLEWKIATSTSTDLFNFTDLDLRSIHIGDAKAVIKIVSLSNASGILGDSNVTSSFSTAAGVVNTFNFGTVSSLRLSDSQSITDVFTFDTSAFTFGDSSGTSAGLWSINFDGGFMTLTAVPEPSTYGFGIGALALALAALRRRKQKAREAKESV